MKTCADCGVEKPVDEFYTRWPSAKNYVRSLCIPCDRRSSEDRRLRKRYGITKAEYDQMHANQQGLCALCGREESLNKNLAVDHDHQTGKVRALLCGACNRGLGFLGDDATLLQRATNYVLFGGPDGA